MYRRRAQVLVVNRPSLLAIWFGSLIRRELVSGGDLQISEVFRKVPSPISIITWLNLEQENLATNNRFLSIVVSRQESTKLDAC